jgi:DNA-directed RNA polymerase subunit alpha
VTSIRIDGVLHEFTTVEGVKEDVTDIILNLKELVVSSESDEPVVMYLRKQGPGEVTAADIAPPAGVTVHNPDLKIATINKKARLEIELVVERGRGYVTAVQNKQPGQEIGRIPVDSIYSPVLKVTYAVDPDAGDRRARDGRQQRAAQRVAERVAEAGLERLDDEPGPVRRDGLFTKRGALRDEHVVFLSSGRPPYDVPQWAVQLSADPRAAELPRGVGGYLL